MKRLTALLLCSILFANNALSQTWSDWIDVGGGIQVSFKFPPYSCKGYTFGRMRNTSSNKYCEARVTFNTNCGGNATLTSYQIKPGELNESKGNWYITSGKVSNIKLAKLSDDKCKTISSNTSGLSGNTTSNNTGQGTAIYQNDNLVNPTAQIGYSQKQKDDDAAADNAMQAWKNSYQDAQNQINKINNLQNDIKQQQPNKQQLQTQQQLTQQQQAQQKLNEVQQQLAEQQQHYQQTEMELDNAKNVSMNAYQEAVNSGRQQSGAMIDATLAGAQQISDPKASLTYTGIGLGIALVSWISEKKEAQRVEMLKREEEERQRRLEELKAVKASLKTSSTVFNFISSTTNYHYTNLKIEIKRKMVKSVSRKDLYDVTVEIHKVLNTTDSIFIYESVKFKNLATSTDSCVISKISIPLRYVNEAQIYNGDYTNAYDPKSSTNQIFRHKNLTNVQIQNAFTIAPMFNEGNQIGSIHSELIDISIEMLGNFIKIQKKYTPSKPTTINDADFDGINGFSANKYMLVLDANSSNANNFVDYLNFIKN